MRVVGRRKELARLLALELNAVRLEEAHRVFDGELAQDRADRARRAARVGLLVDRVVRDIAAPAACDEDLGADDARAVECDDARSRAASMDRGEQPRGTRTDDDEVCVLDHGASGFVGVSATEPFSVRAFSASTSMSMVSPALPVA